MRHLSLVFMLLVFCSGSLQTSAAGERGRRADEPVYIEETNGLFSVCQFVAGTNTIHKWKGVYVPETEVSAIGPYRFGLVYRYGERPKQGSNPFHHYGVIPYPVEDMDPPIESCLAEDGTLLLGFKYLHGTFYAIEKVDKPELKGQVPKKNWSKVIRVEVPKHRAQEAKNFLREVVKEKDVGKDNSGITPTK